ncbi:MAG TPA: sn-glycerol-3-phosphate ABC transporter substrate-binding protein UgpB [Acetobacteraceae bacterium]|jgi:sn-glycerol 3-phosphate transport system substrate-binding protein
MKRRTLLAGAVALAATPIVAAQRVHAQAADGKTKVVFWHAMNGALGEEVNRLATAFNASQAEVEVQPVFKGSYPDLLTAAIAAARAGQAPHLAQIFEVGTGTMLAAGPAVKQAWQLSQETGVKIDPANYVPAVRGYYSLSDGRMASIPFNSSTTVMWYNKDAFAMAGLDPENPPSTWQELVAQARVLKDKWAIPTMTKAKADGKTVPDLVAMTTAWPTWIHVEQYSALHNLPFASKSDGFDGLDAVLEFNSPKHVKHIQRLLDMAKEGTFRYAGRDNSASPIFTAGGAGIQFDSSGNRGDIAKGAQFRWAETYMPYDPEIIKAPNNAIIGGASLWCMTAPKRTPAEYAGVARFIGFLATPENAAAWHQHTGYVSVTLAGYELSKQQGFYDKNVGADLPLKELTRGTVTNNSRGLRLGRLPEIRNIMQEELEKALQGQQTAQQAMDASATRGNRVLREFEKSVRS